ncbi:hypothetical protein LMH87_010238 [Akanthomyces muscarius]|uniref:H/ACA ribonucleoprotein complex non-core subunit NAF1 n=1 Tax=Akanthomyces muscarius TaxID=2231603 RepID=A0A9W8QFM5_AKAMU|nr:hypothetical protein LMH87_010238 [Akanthomyces muscarius]KAJ4153764.1 hypothetical protein LMH87_010238 [Akanthomyces muscarius]
MSGFQIPGLGQAKPNETLPPLPPDLAAAAASAAGHEDLPDASEQQTTETTSAETPAPAPAPTTASAPPPTTAHPETDPDAMVVDEQPPASPPSLTSALEAAIGGLGSADPAQPPAQEQAQPTEPVEMQTMPLQNDAGDNPEWEIDSSPYESSSESSSDSSSDDDSDNEGYELLGVEETARMLMEAEGGSDDDAGGPSGAKAGSGAQLRTKNEVADDAVTRPDVTITEAMPLEELGAVSQIVDNTALVTGITPGEYQVLDAGSVLCTASRVVVGAVAETIGKVTRPMYTVRFNGAEEMAALGCAVGTTLYYTPAHATFVFTEPLKGLKGSDASNLYDEEAGDEEVEFSDDEKEAEHKRAVKQKKKDKWKANNPEKAAAAAAARAKDHPLRQQHNVDAGLNYDDDDDGPYKPLARPSSLASGPGSSQYDRPASSSSRQGGGGRRGGDFRGRGRGGGRGGRGGYARGGGGSSGNSSSRDGYALPPQGAHQQNHYAQPPAPPSMPQGAFGMQFPGWPPAPAPGAVPPPPPGWPVAAPAAATVPPPLQVPGQQQQQGGAAGGLGIDPSVLAAVMAQFQAHVQSQGGQQPPAWGGQGR